MAHETNQYKNNIRTKINSLIGRDGTTSDECVAYSSEIDWGDITSSLPEDSNLRSYFSNGKLTSLGIINVLEHIYDNSQGSGSVTANLAISNNQAEVTIIPEVQSIIWMANVNGVTVTPDQNNPRIAVIDTSGYMGETNTECQITCIINYNNDTSSIRTQTIQLEGHTITQYTLTFNDVNNIRSITLDEGTIIGPYTESMTFDYNNVQNIKYHFKQFDGNTYNRYYTSIFDKFTSVDDNSDLDPTTQIHSNLAYNINYKYEWRNDSNTEDTSLPYCPPRNIVFNFSFWKSDQNSSTGMAADQQTKQVNFTGWYEQNTDEQLESLPTNPDVTLGNIIEIMYTAKYETVKPSWPIINDNNPDMQGYEFIGWSKTGRYTKDANELITSQAQWNNEIIGSSTGNTFFACLKKIEEPEQEYYWYVGTSQDKPTSLPEDDSQLASGNSEGWRKIEATSSVVYDASNNPIRFNTGDYYWLIIPTGMKVETADGTNYLDGFDSDGNYAPDSTTIPNHTIYASSNAGIEFTGIIKY